MQILAIDFTGCFDYQNGSKVVMCQTVIFLGYPEYGLLEFLLRDIEKHPIQRFF